MEWALKQLLECIAVLVIACVAFGCTDVSRGMTNPTELSSNASVRENHESAVHLRSFGADELQGTWLLTGSEAKSFVRMAPGYSSPDNHRALSVSAMANAVATVFNDGSRVRLVLSNWKYWQRGSEPHLGVLEGDLVAFLKKRRTEDYRAEIRDTRLRAAFVAGKTPLFRVENTPSLLACFPEVLKARPTLGLTEYDMRLELFFEGNVARFIYIKGDRYSIDGVKWHVPKSLSTLNSLRMTIKKAK